jgi:hypothetical protein
LQTPFAKTQNIYSLADILDHARRTVLAIPEGLDGSNQRELPRRWSACASILCGCLVCNGSRCGDARLARGGGSSGKVRRLGPSAAKGRPLFHDLTRGRCGESRRILSNGEWALSTQTIESQPVGYSKEQVADSWRWLALPVLLTGAFLPILPPDEQGRAFGFYGATFGSPQRTHR